MPKDIEEVLRNLTSSQQEECGKMVVEFTGRAMQSLIAMSANEAEAEASAERIADSAVTIATATVFALLAYMKD